MAQMGFQIDARIDCSQSESWIQFENLPQRLPSQLPIYTPSRLSHAFDKDL